MMKKQRDWILQLMDRKEKIFLLKRIIEGRASIYDLHCRVFIVQKEGGN
jgi:hypothetical protein